MASTAAVPQPPSEAGLKERFFRYFQHEVTALQAQMERLSTTASAGGERADAIDHCLAGINRLSHEVKDASSYIPAYDQRTYADAIKALSEKLQHTRNALAPPKKFQFKTARKNNSAISLADAAELAQSARLKVPGGGGGGGGAGSGADSGVSSGFAPTPLERLSPGEEKRDLHTLGLGEGCEGAGSREKGAGVAISNHTGSHIILPTSSSHSASSATVSNLRHSVVDLSPPTANGGPFANMTLKNIKDSLTVCGQVAGPIHITGVENSVIVTACRQFRMHGSKNVDVYLHCSSRPIIEDCEGIRFAPLPSTYVTTEILQTLNQYDQIDDFKWLKAEASPHFRFLAEADRVGEDVWEHTVPGGHNVSLGDILRAVKVPRGPPTVRS
ncbi:TBCC-domain-containing protein [Lentithecium fluviatile CBS 122367]|uniref:TBCC-domain-containing protein n=1 Tax=Lentithecium fluviatile CBS 122367 TaxID=1168545 RepID=A0A6G1J5L3_9PLEO|nr:TBCC-domain-containing protein [Lentithecium fluviatile CBS 122367]